MRNNNVAGYGYHDNEDEEIYMENRLPEIMEEEDYNPAEVSHLSEAISQASEADQETIKDYIEQRDWAKLGLKLYTMSYDYMEKYAIDAVQREIEQGL